MATDTARRDLEAVVLGAALMDPSAALLVEVDDFAGGDHRAIAEGICQCRKRGEPVDCLLVDQAIRSANKIGLLDAGYLTGLTDKLPSSVNAAHYARKLRELRVRDEFKAAAISAVADARSEKELPDVASNLINETTRALARIEQPGRETLASVYDVIEKWQTGTEDPTTPTGFTALDERYCPARGELVLIGARPSVGKSALLIQIAENIAAMSRPVLFVSVEMSAQTVHVRRLSASARVSGQRIRTRNGLHEDDWTRLTNAAGTLKDRPFDVVFCKPSLGDLQVLIATAKQTKNIEAVCVDHLGLINPPEADRHDLALGKITSALASQGKMLGVTVFLASQLNRDSEKGDEPRPPRLADLRNSGEIEQDADIVLLLHRPQRYQWAAPTVQLLEIQIAKHRDGPCGETHLLFDMETGRMTSEAQ